MRGGGRRERDRRHLEVVVDGDTGFLVRLDQEPGELEPVDPEAFATEFAERVNRLVRDPDLAARMGAAGRRRAIERFSWPQVAERTLAVYEDAVARKRPIAAAPAGGAC